MNWMRAFTATCLALACAGLILPQAVLEAAPPARLTPNASTLASDVELDAEGSLRGVVIDVQGVPIAGASVVVCDARGEVARTLTDGLGCFSVDGLGGGTYQVTIGRYTKRFRTWAACTAPPKTRQMALVVVGDDVVRGQRPLGQLILSEPVIITGMVGAMIAVPVAVHQANQREPNSP